MTGIAGHLASHGALVPLQIRVPAGRAARSRTFHFEVVDNRFFLTSSSAHGLHCFQRGERRSASAPWTASAGESEERRRSLATCTTCSHHLASERARSQGLRATLRSPSSIRSSRRGARDRSRSGGDARDPTATVEEMIVDQSTIEPGKSIAVTVYLRPYRADRIAIPISVPVPHDALPGPMLLRVCSTDEATRWESERAPRRFVPSSLAQLVELYEETSGPISSVTLYGTRRGGWSRPGNAGTPRQRVLDLDSTPSVGASGAGPPPNRGPHHVPAPGCGN